MDSRIELRHLRYFVAVAEELHFGRAARRLRIAQPALSQQIRRLEGFIGAALFERTSRSVRLTAAGEAFLPRADALLGRLSADVAETGRIARGEAGRLDIAFISSAAGPMSSALLAFTADRPEVRIRLQEGFTSTTLDRLQRAAADVGFVRDAEERNGISLTTLLAEPFVAVLPITHPSAARPAVEAAQLAGSPLVLFPARAGAHAHAVNLQPFREAALEPDIAFEGSEWNTILHLVSARLGVTIAPRSAARPLPAGTVAIPLTGTDARSTVQLATRAEDDRPLVRQFGTIATTMIDAARHLPGRHPVDAT
ncbi:LysR substrate-binding domain-containing protein [Microlunatus soli]|uniref:DNA-binding transcriptional regulator, LysR family n=1 Tax=Microlunatus soli TaxID=630515 RepID=A0A1H1WVL9_9ACTN|nr:LysR substrate-binding domain-containing protein [Microlunatus soli]SDT00426.1 DNA-binding transcriptional regulator, LysR family [Microlunatus soli]